jgi:diketogulonate reductase-like aldo/keto reductase
VPFAETMEAFESLQRAGKIRHFGVSNFDLGDMQELSEVPGGQDVAVNQLLYNLTRRGIEFDLLPWLRGRGIPVMAYSPIEQARLLRSRKLTQFAKQAGMSPAQAALAWLLARDGVIAIPKTSNRARLRENFATLEHPLSAAQLADLDLLFAAPSAPQPLEML